MQERAGEANMRPPYRFGGKGTRRVSPGLLEARCEPGTRRFPIPLDRDDGYLQHFGDVLFAQPAEEPQLHHPSRTRVGLCERR